MVIKNLENKFKIPADTDNVHDYIRNNRYLQALYTAPLGSTCMRKRDHGRCFFAACFTDTRQKTMLEPYLKKKFPSAGTDRRSDRIQLDIAV